MPSCLSRVPARRNCRTLFFRYAAHYGIKDLREDRDLRHSDVAKATGIDQRTLSNYETGKTNPDSYALIKLADFFDVSIDYLVGRSDMMHNDTADVINALESARNSLDEAIAALRRGSPKV